MKILQTTFDSPLGRQAASIRLAVFVEEQKVPPSEELDHHDATASHFVALDGDRVIATLRVVSVMDPPKGPAAKIGRVAVSRELRGQGIGRELMLAAIDYSRQKKFPKCILESQVPVIGFYEKLGFIAHGDVFMECNIPHRYMTLELDSHG